MSRPRRSVLPKKYAPDDSESEEGYTKMEIDPEICSDSEEASNFEDSDDDASEVGESFTIPASVHVKTGFEVQQTRTLVAQKRQKVAILQAKYQEQKKIANELDARLRDAQRDLFETEALIAPIICVPPEILGLIFVAHVQENKQSPWLVMHVSRAWRAAALMTRAIWGRILLTHPGWVKSKIGGRRVRFYDGMEVCYKQVQLNRALKRAGATPLDLKIEFAREHTRRRWRYGALSADSELLTLLDIVLNHQKVVQLRSLNVASELGFPLLPKLDGFNFVNLVSLVLNEEHPGVMEKVLKESRGLRSMHVRGGSLVKMQGYTQWDRLEELGVDFVTQIRDKEFLRLTLSASTDLVSLTLGTSSLSAVGQDEPLIYMPSLKRLQMGDVKPFWPIDCPNLTHLILRNAKSPIGMAPGRIRLPQLIELSFSSDYYSSDNALCIFDTSSLQKLDFSCNRGKAHSASIFKKIWSTSTSAMEPRSFTLRNTPINQKTLARMLAERALLEEFCSAEIVIGTEFFDILLPAIVKGAKKSQRKSSWYIPCPTLKHLSIDLVTRRKIKQEQGTVEASANAFIAARRKAGAPIEKVAMRFSKEEGWKVWLDVGMDA